MNEKKEFHEFRLVEIEDEDKFTEVASFEYPYWKDQKS